MMPYRSPHATVRVPVLPAVSMMICDKLSGALMMRYLSVMSMLSPIGIVLLAIARGHIFTLAISIAAFTVA